MGLPVPGSFSSGRRTGKHLPRVLSVFAYSTSSLALRLGPLLRAPTVRPERGFVGSARARCQQDLVSHAQIASFYRANGQLFHVLAQREIEILGNDKRDVVEKAKKKIETGARFLTVARRVSMVPEAPDGLRHVIRRQEEPPFNRTIFAATPQCLSAQ